MKNKTPIIQWPEHDTFYVVYSYTGIAIIGFIASLFFVEIAFWVQFNLVLAGFIFYTLTEYLIHRFLMHRLANDGRAKWPSGNHMYHHKFPDDDKRVDIDLKTAMVLLVVFFFVFFIFLRQYVFAVFPGYLIGYSLYHYIHYKIHVSPQPKNIFKYLWRHHHVHHHIDDSVAFGVTSPFWDMVFGTMPKR